MLLKVVTTALFLGVTLPVAFADTLPVSGLISVGGSATYTNTDITFTGLGSVFGKGTGTFSNLPLCDACVSYPVNPFEYGSGFVAGLPIFDVVDGGTEVILNVTSIGAGTGVDSYGDLIIHGTGILSETGYTASIGTFTLSSQFGDTGASVSFSNSAMATAVTPEPASLLLVGTGLFCALAVVRRRSAETVV